MLRTGFVMEGLGPFEQHIQRKLASPDMLDAHADELLVVRDHHRLDRLEDLVDTLLGQRNFASGQLCLEMRQQRSIARLCRGCLEEIQLFALVTGAFALGVLGVVRKGRGTIRVDREMLVERAGQGVMEVRLDKALIPVLFLE